MTELREQAFCDFDQIPDEAYEGGQQASEASIPVEADEVWAEYLQLALRHARAISRGSFAANSTQDAAQSAVINYFLITKRRRIESPRAYIATTARNELRDIMRQSLVELLPLADPWVEEDSFEGANLDPATIIENQDNFLETLARLVAAFQTADLPDREIAAVRMRANGKSPEDIAAYFKLPTANAASALVFRGREKIREALAASAASKPPLELLSSATDTEPAPVPTYPYHTYTKWAHETAQTLTNGDTHLAQDIAQHALFCLLSHPRQIALPEQYMLTVMRRGLKNEKVRHQRTELLGSFEGIPDSQLPTITDTAEVYATDDKIRKLCETLSDKVGAAMLLHILEGMTAQEIAKELNVTYPAAYAQLREGRNILGRKVRLSPKILYD